MALRDCTLTNLVSVQRRLAGCGGWTYTRYVLMRHWTMNGSRSIFGLNLDMQGSDLRTVVKLTRRL